VNFCFGLLAFCHAICIVHLLHLFSTCPVLADFDGDLSLCLDPQPAPPTPTVTDTLDLSTTLVDEGPAEEEGVDAGAEPPKAMEPPRQEKPAEPKNAETVPASENTDVSATISEKLKSTG
jgi:hypothetical protein